MKLGGKEKDLKKYLDALVPYTYQCKICGRKRIIRYNEDRTLCDHCGHYIYKSDKIEFRYKCMEALKK